MQNLALPLLALLFLPCHTGALPSLPSWPSKAESLVQRKSEEQFGAVETSAETNTFVETEREEMLAGAATLLSEYFNAIKDSTSTPEDWMSLDTRRFEPLSLMQDEELDKAGARLMPQQALRHEVLGMVKQLMHTNDRPKRFGKGIQGTSTTVHDGAHVQNREFQFELARELRARIQAEAPFLRQWDMYDRFVRGSMSIVLGWPIEPANPKYTDRVAVTILLEGIRGRYVEHNVQYVIRSVVHRLGPGWALHIFHGDDRRYSLEKNLGYPRNVMWTLATVDGKPVPLSHDWNSRVRWSRDFYKAIPEHHEHILIFELDSLLLKSNCVDKFLNYDLVGAPGLHPQFPEGWLNGGFTLRRRSTFWKAVNLYNYSEARHLTPGDNPDEDNIATTVLHKMGANVAPDEVARNFSFESVPNSTSCAFHKPWLYADMYDSMRSSLALADF